MSDGNSDERDSVFNVTLVPINDDVDYFEKTVKSVPTGEEPKKKRGRPKKVPEEVVPRSEPKTKKTSERTAACLGVEALLLNQVILTAAVIYLLFTK